LIFAAFSTPSIPQKTYDRRNATYDEVTIFKVTRKPAVAKKPRDAAAVLFGLKFADDIYYKFKSSQASKARLQSSKHTGTKQN